MTNNEAEPWKASSLSDLFVSGAGSGGKDGFGQRLAATRDANHRVEQEQASMKES